MNTPPQTNTIRFYAFGPSGRLLQQGHLAVQNTEPVFVVEEVRLRMLHGQMDALKHLPTYDLLLELSCDVQSSLGSTPHTTKHLLKWNTLAS